MAWCWPLRAVLSAGDDATEVFKKAVLVVTVCLGILVSVFLIWKNSSLKLDKFAPIPNLLGSIAILVQMMVEKRIRISVTACFLCVTAVSLILYDYKGAVMMDGRVWPMFVLLLDITLVCRLPHSVAVVLITSIMVWLVVCATEDAYRWGLYDVRFLVPADKRDMIFSCEKPPCPLGFSISLANLIANGGVFLLDFYFTRGFASELQKEQDSMQNVINAAEWIAHCLSRFDLASAEAAITTSPLPPPLHQALTNLLANLHSYRPYLPQSCLQEYTSERGSQSEDTVPSSLEVPRSRSGSSLSSQRQCTSEGTRCLKKAEKTRISYTVTNLLGSHALIVNIDEYASGFEAYITEHVAAVVTYGGVVGVVVGDHVHASFNAVKRCVGHLKCSVEAALAVRSSLADHGVDVVTGIATGEAYCSPLGSADLMTFCMVGEGVVTSSAMERYGTWHRLPIICSSAVYKQVCCLFMMKIAVAHVTIRSSTGERKDVPYQVLPDDDSGPKSPNEWMYELEANPWETYNRAGLAVLNEDPLEAERVLRMKTGDKTLPPEVASAEEWLMGVIRGRLQVASCVF